MSSFFRFRFARPLASCSPLFAVALVAATLSVGEAAAQTTVTFTGGAISLQGNGGNTVQVASSTASASGITGPISNVSVTLHGLFGANSDGLNDFSFLLAPPGSSNTAFDFLNATCNTASNTTLTIEENAPQGQAPDGDTNCSYAGSSYAYSPYNTASAQDVWPGISNPIMDAPPRNQSGTFDVFSGLSGSAVNGAWTLYIGDQVPNDCSGACSKVSITSWTLTITYSASAVSTTTSLAPSSNMVFTSGNDSGITLTATVTSSGGTPTGTVAFYDNGSLISGCGSAALGGGQATCTTAFSTEGTQSLTASYTPSGSYSASNSDNSPAIVTSSNHTAQSGNQYCNNGTLTSADIVTSPLPSKIFIGSPDNTSAPTGGGTISSVSLTLKSVNTGSQAAENDQQFLLAGPGGNILVFAANAGSVTDGSSFDNVIFEDSASSLAPSPSSNTGIANNTSYKPTDYFDESPAGSATGQAAFPSGTPSFTTADQAAPTGLATFQSQFTGGATGAWSLYYSNIENGSATVGGWCLNFTMTGGTPTSTSVTSTKPTALTTDSFSFTATVTDTSSPSTPVSEGSVSFTATSSTGASISLGSASVSGGTATVNIAANTFTEGTYEIAASFVDSGEVFGPSHGSVAERINNPPPTPAISGSTYVYCNTTPIVVPYTDAFSAPGNAAPYPSNIIVSNLPGTLNSVAVQMTLAGSDGNSAFNDFQNVASLLIGPNNANIDFFSNVGGFGNSSGAFTISDSGTTRDPYSNNDAPPVAGTYLPESYGVGGGPPDAFPACPSLVSNCSSGTPVGPPAPTASYNYAASEGSATFSSVFPSGTNANGAWSLYLYADVSDHPLGTITSWCIDLTENLPALSISTSGPSSVSQGQTGVQYTVTVGNSGPGSTGGSITVTDTASSGLTITAMSGTGWTCTTLPTCTRSDALTAGDTYPITVTANVSGTATSPQTDYATLTNSGSTNAQSGLQSNTVSTTVAQPTTTVASNATASFSSSNQNVTLNANVTSGGSGVTSGSVTFTVASIAGSATSAMITNGSASATFVIPGNTAAGSYAITATYNPGSGYASSSDSSHSLTIDAAPTVTNLSSTVSNGTYGVGAVIPITVTFSKAVTVTGTPQLALNSGGTAGYTSGSGTSTLTFTYTVAAGQSSSALDAASTAALTLNGGTIQDSNSTNANLTLPTPGAAGSLSANKSIVINTTPPQVVSFSVDWGSESYNLVSAARTTHLPWTVTGVTVVFSKPIGTATAASLSGFSAQGVSGVGTSTLTWTVNPVSNATISAALSGSGANAIKDTAGNPLAGGSGFTQALSILYGDFNGDGAVTSTDMVDVNAARSAAYNLFADINGDGVVNTTDVSLVKGLEGATQQ